eukprot:TRINITY_DN17994_c0_g1_i1.p1 TRINITY_DN17994_c0_g1~~TRINITY_DN17994_c0_g1_i1.p1  ORF type:complete len:536 (-),score=178.47 TRINITY_DN17994_c0_g1_i1:508-2115(-)
MSSLRVVPQHRKAPRKVQRSRDEDGDDDGYDEEGDELEPVRGGGEASTSSKNSVVSAVCWVPRGKFAQFPVIEKPEADEVEEAAAEEEEEAVAARAAAEEEAAAEEGEEELDEETREVAKQYGMDTYEDDEGLPLTIEPFYKTQEEDPNIVNPNEEEDSEVEEYTVMPTDMFVLAATTDVDDNFSHLDVHVYEEQDENMYCHHDIILPAFPLCLAWMDMTPQSPQGATGNYVAVGTFEPGIELWNLDIVDPVAPVGVLGGPAGEGAGAAQLDDDDFDMDDKPRKKKKKNAKKGKKGGLSKRKLPSKVRLKPGSHTDSVLALSWNSTQRNLIASASADKTVKLWDATTLGVVHTYTHHSDKVQCVLWNPRESSVCLTAAFDRTACLLDVRVEKPPLTFALGASDPESCDWNFYAQSQFLISLEDGHVRCLDALAGGGAGSSVWTLAAHDKAATSVAVSTGVRGLIATTSLDRTFKLWSTITGAPRNVYSRNTTEPVYSAAFSPDNGYLLAIGSNSRTTIVDTAKLNAVVAEFPKQS